MHLARSWLLLALASAACSSGTDIDCAQVDPFPWAIVVDVFDDTTGERMADGFQGWTEGADGTRRDMDPLVGPGTLAALIPEGTYDVFVTAEGFAEWESRGVETRAGVCGGFQAVELEARMLPREEAPPAV